MRVSVTRQDIVNGTRSVPWACSIALAVKRAAKRDDVCVTRSFIRVGAEYHDIPRKAVEFVNNFDYERPVKPFKFDLDGEL